MMIADQRVTWACLCGSTPYLHRTVCADCGCVRYDGRQEPPWATGTVERQYYEWLLSEPYDVFPVIDPNKLADALGRIVAAVNDSWDGINAALEAQVPHGSASQQVPG